MSIYPQTRAEAREIGLTFYFGGRRCRRGHHPMRYTSTANCCQCLDEQAADNHDSIRIRASAWHKAHRAESLARERARGRLFSNAKCAARRAKKLQADGYYTAADVRLILEKQKRKCANCLARLGEGFHVDHIQPLSRGGSNWPHNIQILCAPCNLTKSAKDPITFARQCGRLL